MVTMISHHVPSGDCSVQILFIKRGGNPGSKSAVPGGSAPGKQRLLAARSVKGWRNAHQKLARGIAAVQWPGLYISSPKVSDCIGSVENGFEWTFYSWFPC
jgi:hypothetical protein